MGSDMYMESRNAPPDPLDVQVKRVMDERNELRKAAMAQRDEIKRLKQQHDADGQMIARLMREKEVALGFSDGEIVSQCPTCREYGVACRCA
jgi:hypothetical protein